MDKLETSSLLQVVRNSVVTAIKEALGSYLGRFEASNKLVWRIDEVADQISLSPSTIRNLLDADGPWFDPEFPKPIRLGNGAGARSAIGWRRVDIVAWVDSRPAHESLHQLNRRAVDTTLRSARGKTTSIRQSLPT